MEIVLENRMDWSINDIENWNRFLNSETGQRLIPKVLESAAFFFLDVQEWDKARSILVSNKRFMDAKFTTVKPDSSLLKQYELNNSYEKGLADIRTKSARERSLYQKSSKVMSYGGRKKR